MHEKVATIRQYQDTDKEGLVRCMRHLQEYLAGIDPLHLHRGGDAFDAEAYTNRILEKVAADAGMVYVAVEGPSVIGCVAGIVLPQTKDGSLLEFQSKKGEVLELYLDPASRGKGTGKALMTAMEKYLGGKGCSGCYVGAFSPNVSGQAFYRKCGYQDRVTSFLKVFDKK